MKFHTTQTFSLLLRTGSVIGFCVDSLLLSCSGDVCWSSDEDGVFLLYLFSLGGGERDRDFDSEADFEGVFERDLDRLLYCNLLLRSWLPLLLRCLLIGGGDLEDLRLLRGEEDRERDREYRFF